MNKQTNLIVCSTRKYKKFSIPFGLFVESLHNSHAKNIKQDLHYCTEAIGKVGFSTFVFFDFQTCPNNVKIRFCALRARVYCSLCVFWDIDSNRDFSIVKSLGIAFVSLILVVVTSVFFVAHTSIQILYSEDGVCDRLFPLAVWRSFSYLKTPVNCWQFLLSTAAKQGIRISLHFNFDPLTPTAHVWRKHKFSILSLKHWFFNLCQVLDL